MTNAKSEQVLAIARKIVDAEASQFWLLQHGHEDQTYEQVMAGLDLLNSQIRKLRDELVDLVDVAR